MPVYSHSKWRFIIIFTLIFSLVGCKSLFGDKDDNPFKDESADDLYSQAQESLKKHEYTSAIKRLEAMDSMYPFHEKTEQSQLQLIYAYYEKEDFGSCAASADRFIHLYPRSNQVDYAYYMKGMANFRQQRGALAEIAPMDLAWRDPGTQSQAYSDFATLVERFPNSKYTPNAKQRMIYLRNLFAAREMHTANYYYYRQMYVAASERANYVVRNYAQSSSARPALGLMYYSYLKLGMKESADEALSVYQATYHCNPKKPKNSLKW
ncbi:MAG TPA: outer membrane protein assembly factor BamD [Legionellales bacterium]|nr:outer membrane protein assembly factor BamD [Legionellales bacterium]